MVVKMCSLTRQKEKLDWSDHSHSMHNTDHNFVHVPFEYHKNVNFQCSHGIKYELFAIIC